MARVEEPVVHAGGCQCGAVRFAVRGEPEPATVCHCRMCQKAFGGPFAVLATVRLADLAWTRGAPAFFPSSDVVERGFCPNCGTPLTFGYRGEDTIGLALGAFDRPAAVPLSAQLWTSARVPAAATLHALPAHAEDLPGYEETVKAVAASNHQHPDHDTADWTPRRGRRACADGDAR